MRLTARGRAATPAGAFALGLALALAAGAGGCGDGKKPAPAEEPAAAAAAALAPDAEPPPPKVPPPALAPVEGASVEAGKKLFAARCAGCHGADGKGRTEAAKTLRIAPTDLTTVDYLCRSTEGKPPVPPDVDVETAIDRGEHRGRPEVAGLSPVERRSLLMYVKTLARDFAADPQPLFYVPPAPPDGPESRARGRVMYLAFGCWRCHGVGGAGDGPAAKSLAWNGEPIRRLLPLADRQAYVCGDDPDRLYRTLALGIAGTIMPPYLDYAGKMQRPPPPRETWATALEGLLAPEEIDAVRTWLDGLPDKQAVFHMPPPERRRRAESFLWDLVHYIRSL